MLFFFLQYLLLNVGIIISDNKLFRNLNTVEIKVFSKLFCLLMERSGSVQIITNPDSGGPKTYESYGCRTQREKTFKKGAT